MTFLPRDGLWAAICGILVAGLIVQSSRLDDAQVRLREAESKPYWPDRPEIAGLEASREPRFAKSTRTSIPESFWGEFAEDVHECGGERSVLVKSREIIWPDEGSQSVVEVQWVKPNEIELETVGGTSFANNYSMLLAGDRNEIIVRYTNLKRVIQRCSARAHAPPEVLKEPESWNAADRFLVNLALDDIE